MASDFIEQLNELDYENIGDWPPLVKIAAMVLLIFAVSGLGYYFIVSDQIKLLERLDKKEDDLRGEFERKQKKAANLDAYKKQMEEVQQQFGSLLRQLPKSTEVPGLIEDISFAASNSGLDFKEVEMKGERRTDLFTELPLDMEAIGTYHQFGNFVSKVSGLPRIVTLHDFTITPIQQRTKSGGTADKLMLKVRAKTYRYDETEGQ